MVYRFVASRLSPGNRLFPTVIEVSDRHVMRIKPSFVSRIEESISLRQVSSVTINRGVLWSDVVVHSSGGTDPLRSSGHTNADADRLKQVIEEYQANIAQMGIADPSGLRTCPRCAEFVRPAAQVCRHCGADLPIELTEEAEAAAAAEVAADDEDEASGWRW